MPIIAPAETTDPQFYERLQACGAHVMSEEVASRQDIRPARIGLLNLMPAAAMEGTELRWLRFMSHSMLQIEPVLVKFNDDCRENRGSRRAPILQRYTSFDEAAESGLDGLIVSGDNQERRADGTPRPFDELHYDRDLSEVIDWADTHVGSVILSCLASHYALQRRHGIERTIRQQKMLGVFAHQITGQGSVTAGLDDCLRAPHSRWGNVDAAELDAHDISVLAYSDEAGWLLAEEPTSGGGTLTYIQGHPEYWRHDLHDEFARDQDQMPRGYYPNDNPTQRPYLSWSNDARAVFSNWIHGIYDEYSFAG